MIDCPKPNNGCMLYVGGSVNAAVAAVLTIKHLIVKTRRAAEKLNSSFVHWYNIPLLSGNDLIKLPRSFGSLGAFVSTIPPCSGWNS